MALRHGRAYGTDAPPAKAWPEAEVGFGVIARVTVIPGLLAARRPDAALTLAVDYDHANPLLDLDDATKLLVDEERRIRAIGKTIADYNAIDTGIFHATTALLDALRLSLDEGGAGSLSEGVQRLARDGRAFVHDIGKSWWLDVDDEPAFRKAEARLARKAIR